METGPQLKISYDRLVKPGIEPATPGLQGKLFYHYTTAAPNASRLKYIKRAFKEHKGKAYKLVQPKANHSTIFPANCKLSVLQIFLFKM